MVDLGAVGILDIKITNHSLGGGSGQPPADLTGCHVFLGSRLLDHWLAGPLLQFRHVYINIYEDASNYALIEAGPNDENRTTNGTTHAEVYYGKWESTWCSVGNHTKDQLLGFHYVHKKKSG